MHLIAKSLALLISPIARYNLLNFENIYASVFPFDSLRADE